MIASDPITEQIQSRLTVAVDEVATSITEQSRAITLNILQAMAVMAKITSENEVASDYINSLVESLKTNQQPPITFTSNLTTAYNLTNPELEAEAERRLAEARRLLEISNELQRNHTANLLAVDASIAATEAARESTINAMCQLADGLVNRTYPGLPSSSACDDSNPFIAVVCTIGQVALIAGKTSIDLAKLVGEGVLDVVGEAPSLLGKMLGATGGGLFDGILTLLQPVLIIGAVVLVVYLVWMWWERKQAANAMSQAISSGMSATQYVRPMMSSGLVRSGLDSMIPKQQHETSGRFRHMSSGRVQHSGIRSKSSDTIALLPRSSNNNIYNHLQRIHTNSGEDESDEHGNQE